MEVDELLENNFNNVFNKFFIVDFFVHYNFSHKMLHYEN